MTRQPLPRLRHRDLAELAEAVAETCSDSGRVEPARALDLEGAQVRYGDFHDAFDGLLECRGGRFWAYVNLPRNGGHPDAPRARFTLAHETGHFFIETHRRALLAGQPPHGSTTDFASHLRVEQEADLFAAHLLMPAARVRTRHRRAAPGLAGVLALADAFGTSRTSTALRVAHLDLAPCAAIRWRPDGSSWAAVSASLRALGLTAPITHADQVPRGGATHCILHSGQSDAPLQTGATAAFWFDRVRPGGPRDATLHEEAVGLGPHGAITLLTLIL